MWTLPTDGSANSVSILFPAFKGGIKDMDGTESFLVMLFGGNEGFK